MGPLPFEETSQNPHPMLLVLPPQECSPVATPSFRGSWEMWSLIPLTLGALPKQEGAFGYCGCAALGTRGHQLPFHLARAGPRLVGEAHTA